VEAGSPVQQLLARKHSLRRTEESQAAGRTRFCSGQPPFPAIGQTPAATIKSPSVEPVFACATSWVRTEPFRFSRPPQPRRDTPAYNSRMPNRLVRKSSAPSFESDHTVNFIAGTTCQNMTGRPNWNEFSRSRSSPLPWPRAAPRMIALGSRQLMRAGCRAAGRRDGLVLPAPRNNPRSGAAGRIVIPRQEYGLSCSR